MNDHSNIHPAVDVALARLREGLEAILAHDSGSGTHPRYDDFVNICEEVYFDLLAPTEVFDYHGNWPGGESLKSPLLDLIQAAAWMRDQDLYWDNVDFWKHPIWKSIRLAARYVLQQMPPEEN